MSAEPTTLARIRALAAQNEAAGRGDAERELGIIHVEVLLLVHAALKADTLPADLTNRACHKGLMPAEQCCACGPVLNLRRVLADVGFGE